MPRDKSLTSVRDRPPRAWHKKHKKMCAVRDVVWIKDTIDSVVIETAPENWEQVISELLILLWPTGLLDKNGTEIYQEDIFKSDDRVSPFVIVFRDGSFRGWYPTAVDPNSPGFHFDSYEASRGKVIGNVHQHPDLLVLKNEGLTRQNPGGEDD